MADVRVLVVQRRDERGCASRTQTNEIAHRESPHAPVLIVKAGDAMLVQLAVVSETVANRMEVMRADPREDLFGVHVCLFLRADDANGDPQGKREQRRSSEVASSGGGFRSFEGD